MHFKPPRQGEDKRFFYTKKAPHKCSAFLIFLKVRQIILLPAQRRHRRFPTIRG